MNLSKIKSDFIFKDYTANLFRVNSYECGLPSKILQIINFDDGDFTARFCGDYLLCVGRQLMLIWRYMINKKVTASYVEYQLPYNRSGHHAKQVMLINNSESVLVTDDGNVRYWPRFNLPNEYVDCHITGITQDKCLLVEIVTDGVLVAVFESTKIIIIDVRNYGECGLTFKLHSQPRGIFSGMGRYLASFVVTQTNDNTKFKNIKVNDLLSENTEVLIMVDNNIDSLYLDILHNSQYQRGIFQQDSLKITILDKLSKTVEFELSEMNVIFKNFDLLYNNIYVFVKVQLKDKWSSVLFTYNMKLKAIDTVVSMDIEILGEVEITALCDENLNNDQLCLLVAIKDNHTVYIVEVLTGIVKCTLDTEQCIKNNEKKYIPSIISWSCSNQYSNCNTKVVTLTALKQIVTINQTINVCSNQSFISHDKNESGFNLSNASFSDYNQSKKNKDRFAPDNSFSNINQLHPSALSTPKSKLDNKGDRFNESVSVQKFMSSTPLIDVDNAIEEDTNGIFKKSVVQYWLGYKSQAKRTLEPLIERAKISRDIPLSVLVLNIVREIIDEYPSKDPRWTKNNMADSNAFFYSNKSLILQQQLNAKKDALQKLFLMLKENGIDLFGPLGSIAPMSVYQSLFMQNGKTKTFFGCNQVSWSVAYCLGFGIELLEFSKVLNEIVTSNNCAEINQIMAKCCQHVLAKQRKLTPLEIISQEISLIPRFIRDCADYLNEKKLSTYLQEHSDNTKDIFILISNILCTCLKSALYCRQQFGESFLSMHFNADLFIPSTSAACWITENQPIGVLDSIIDIIQSLFLFSRTIDRRIFESAIDIVIVILDSFKERISWMGTLSTNEVELQKLDVAYAKIRYELIEKIMEEENAIGVALKLADRFGDFQWLIIICEMLDNKSKNNSHLEPYLRIWSESGFSECVLDWYQDKLKNIEPKNQGKLLAKIQSILEIIKKIEGVNMSSSRMDNSSSSQVINKFLEKTKDLTTKWLHAIEIGDFFEAATSLSRLGEIEESSLYRKKSLVGFAKLSYLADMDMTMEEINEAVNYLDKHLKLIEFQESIPADVLQQQLAFQKDSHQQPVIGVSQLVKLFLASAIAHSKDDDNNYFMRALDLLSFSWCNNDVAKVSLSELNELVIMVWSNIIHQDEWSTMSRDISCERSVLYKVLKYALSQRLSKEIIPNLNKLFEFEKSQDNTTSNEAEFLIRRTFESVVGLTDEDFEESNAMNCN